MSQSAVTHESTGSHHHVSHAVSGFVTSTELKDCRDADSLREIAGGRPLSACAAKIMTARGIEVDS